MSRECGFKEHDLDYTAKDIGKSTSISEIRCRKCGIKMTVKLQSSGRTVRPNVQIYPATGSTTVSRDMISYFFGAYGPTLDELKSAGYQIADNTPTIHGTPVGVGFGISLPIAQIERRGGSGRRSLKTETTRPCRRRRRIIIGISLLAVAGAIAGTIVLLTSPGSHGSSYYVAVSPDGKFIASASSITDNVYLWDTGSKRLIATLADPHRATDSLNAIALSPDGTMIAVAHTNDPVYIWNTATRRVVATITAAAGASGLAFSPDGKTLAICNGNVLLWDVAGRRVEATLTTVKNSADGGAVAAAFSPDGRTLAVSISDNTDQNGNYLAPGIELWDVATRRVMSDLKGGAGGGAIAYTRDGRALAATELGGGSFSLWDVTGKPRLTGEHSLPQANVREYSPIGDGPVAFSPDGTTLATADGSPTNSAYLFDVATGQMTATLTDPNSLAVADLVYTPDGGTLITADGNGNIYLWNLGTRQVAATLTMPNS